MAQGDGGQVEWLEDLVGMIRRVHDVILRESGGVFGEHTASLYSACARPLQSAFGELMYKTPYQFVAALFHGIICDHVFVDGNKRTASVIAVAFLAAFRRRLMIAMPPTDLQVRMLGDVALEAASTRLTVEDVAFWMERIFAPATPPRP